ncbi:MAG: hypothetical protein KDC12_04210 [Flavobacteriales bacterium]|nr:hypothetical protein [Flavobacteriales bacterium]
MRYAFVAIVFLSLFSCKKDPVVFENNDIPPYDEIPTIIVQNYVNRLFIDIIGREPLDAEMDLEVNALEAEDLSMESREDLVEKLMYSEAPLEGDISYNHACFEKLYEDTKARLLEGSSDGFIMSKYDIFRFAAIADSLSGNVTGYEANMELANALLAIIDCKESLRTQTIEINEVYRRMTYNWIYDEINMNTFNFINATFNDMFFRYPTQSEFDNAYSVIEFNEPAQVLGVVVQNKLEYIEALTSTTEFEEGLVRWSFLNMLAREPSAQEVYAHVGLFEQTNDILTIYKSIFKTDEYAGFD